MNNVVNSASLSRPIAAPTFVAKTQHSVGTSVVDPSMSGAEIAPDHRFSIKSAPVGTQTLANAYTHVVDRVVAHVKKHAPPNFEQVVDSLVTGMKKKKRNLRALTEAALMRRIMRRFFKGDRQMELAALYRIVKLSENDQHLKRYGYTSDTLRDFIFQHEHELVAFLNIADTLPGFSHLADANELVRAYQDIVVTTNSPLSAIASICARIGIPNIQTWVPFLTKAAVADLASQDVGADKIHLMFVLAELKNFRILNTLVAALKKVQEERINPYPMARVDNLLKTTLEFVPQPVKSMGIVDKWISLCSHPEQILFLQGYAGVFASLPQEAYQNDDERQNVRSVLQKRIDHLVYTEEE